MQVPKELKCLKQWLLWKDFDGRKVPLNKFGGVSGSTWTQDFCTFDELGDWQRIPDAMPAFCFVEGDGLTGIDIDDCVSDEIVEPWAMEIINRFKSYAEISPSGTGVKIYCYAVKPESMPCRTAVDRGSVEVYEKGRFFAFTAAGIKGLEVVNDQDALNWLAKTYFAVKSTSKKNLPVDFIPPSIDAELFQRLTGYIDSATDYPMPGDRNNRILRLAGNLLAFSPELTPEHIFDLVLTWNNRGPEPLEETEVFKVCQNASKYGTLPTQKENRPTSLYDGPDYSHMLPSNGKPAKILKPVIDLTFPPELLDVPGFVNAVQHHTNSTSFKEQPIFALSGAIALLSSLIGRSVKTPTWIHPNLYFLNIAATASGKDRAREVNAEICQLVDLCIESSISSPTAMLRSIESHLRILWQPDEVSQLLRACNDMRQTLMGGVKTETLKLYSSANYESYRSTFADPKKNIILDRPFMCMLGTGTPEIFFEAITAESIADGFIPRVLSFVVQEKAKRVRANSVTPVPDDIIERARNYASWMHSGELGATSPTVVIPFDSAADDARFKFEDDIDLMEFDPELSYELDIWSRVPQNALKLALVRCASRCVTDRDGMTVNEADVAWGVAVASWSARCMCFHALNRVAENPFDAMMKKVLRAIPMNGQIARKKLTRAIRVNSRDLNSIISRLIEDGNIIAVKGGKGVNGVCPIFYERI